MTDYDAEITKHKIAIGDLERAKAVYEGQTPLQQLADTLHATTCRWNHTDQCEWFYEFDANGVADWNRSGHVRGLVHAKQVKSVLPDMDNSEIIKVVKAIKGIV